MTVVNTGLSKKERKLLRRAAKAARRAQNRKPKGVVWIDGKASRETLMFKKPSAPINYMEDEDGMYWGI